MTLFRPKLGLRQTAGLVMPLLALMSGCAGGLSHYAPSPVNSSFSLMASAGTINTNGQVQLKAVNSSGGTAAVEWAVVRGENDIELGQGSIDASGNYTPPPALTGDTIEVEVEARLRSDPTKAASEVIQVEPGFLQPLTPENATLAGGGSLLITAQLAEVGGGSVDWQLSASRFGGKTLDTSYGVFSQESCQRSPREYTVCSAVYTAPAVLPPSAAEVYVVATVSGAAGSRASRQPLHILLSAAGVASTPLINQSVQTSLVQLGSSGSNNNDADTAVDRSGSSFINDCCGGTLGALLRDESGSHYILSNNHVLAESDQGTLGDNIVQPALIDRNCDQNAGRPVASLRYVVPLKSSQSNVDAALAEVNAASVDPSGAILQFGLPGTAAGGGIGAAAPAAGSGEPIVPTLLAPGSAPLMVAKSGRTTGLTCSAIDAIDLSIEVDYYKDCAETQPYYRKSFTGQIGISGDGFSDSGDSGALVVDAANAEPIGLYFAGGADDRGNGFSVASPIQDVLSELGAEAGRHFSVVGAAEHPVSCLNYDHNGAELPEIPVASRRRAHEAARRNTPQLVNPVAGILDLTAGGSVDSPGDPAVVVYTDKSRENVSVPPTIAGLRTLVIPTDAASIVNGTAPKSITPAIGLHLSEGALRRAQEVRQAYAKRLMADPAIFGVGITQSRDNPSEAALLILVDMTRVPISTPAVVGGLRTRYVYLQRFHVTRSRHAGAPHPSSCAIKSQSAGSPARFNPDALPPLRLQP